MFRLLCRVWSLPVAIILLAVIPSTESSTCSDAECYCPNPSEVFCAGRGSLPLDIVEEAVIPPYVKIYDSRGRDVPLDFLPSLRDAYINLRLLRAEGVRCDAIVPYADEMPYEITHSCHKQLAMYRVMNGNALKDSKEFHQMTTEADFPDQTSGGLSFIEGQDTSVATQNSDTSTPATYTGVMQSAHANVSMEPDLKDLENYVLLSGPQIPAPPPAYTPAIFQHGSPTVGNNIATQGLEKNSPFVSSEKITTMGPETEAIALGSSIIITTPGIITSTDIPAAPTSPDFVDSSVASETAPTSPDFVDSTGASETAPASPDFVDSTDTLEVVNKPKRGIVGTGNNIATQQLEKNSPFVSSEKITTMGPEAEAIAVDSSIIITTPGIITSTDIPAAPTSPDFVDSSVASETAPTSPDFVDSTGASETAPASPDFVDSTDASEVVNKPKRGIAGTGNGKKRFKAMKKKWMEFIRDRSATKSTADDVNDTKLPTVRVTYLTGPPYVNTTSINPVVTSSRGKESIFGLNSANDGVEFTKGNDVTHSFEYMNNFTELHNLNGTRPTARIPMAKKNKINWADKVIKLLGGDEYTVSYLIASAVLNLLSALWVCVSHYKRTGRFCPSPSCGCCQCRRQFDPDLESGMDRANNHEDPHGDSQDEQYMHPTVDPSAPEPVVTQPRPEPVVTHPHPNPDAGRCAIRPIVNPRNPDPAVGHPPAAVHGGARPKVNPPRRDPNPVPDSTALSIGRNPGPSVNRRPETHRGPPPGSIAPGTPDTLVKTVHTDSSGRTRPKAAIRRDPAPALPRARPPGDPTAHTASTTTTGVNKKRAKSVPRDPDRLPTVGGARRYSTPTSYARHPDSDEDDDNAYFSTLRLPNASTSGRKIIPTRCPQCKQLYADVGGRLNHKCDKAKSSTLTDRKPWK